VSIDRCGRFCVGVRAVGLVLALGCVSAGGAAQHLNEGLRAYEAGHYRKAYQVFRDQALQGDPEASFQLSRFYRTGKVVKRDEYAAFEWCRRAAEQGVAQAQYRLGLMYMDGEGVTSDEYEGPAGPGLHTLRRFHHRLLSGAAVLTGSPPALRGDAGPF
jgi:hypothetical protein